MNKLILFDIDGTLITAGGAGTRAMNLAFNELFEIEGAFRNITMAGKTDIQIMKEGLQTHGLPHWNGNVNKMRDRYIHYLKKEINNPQRRLKPGIQESLDMFKGMNVPLGLLTGNLESGAEIKLGACGIYDYFMDGAFGSDHEDRDALLPIAIKKFSARGLDFSADNCIVIGDTPRDVQCAKVHGALCIAVATGPFAKKDLITTGADVVIDSLQETEKYMKFILS